MIWVTENDSKCGQNISNNQRLFNVESGKQWQPH